MSKSGWDSFPPMEIKTHSKPWWKERLKNKYLRSFDSRISDARFLNVKSWMFLTDMSNDVSESVESSKDFDSLKFMIDKEVILSCSSDKLKHQEPWKAVYLSRKNPSLQLRLNAINQTEAELKHHQLALYPHLQVCLPLEMYEDVVEILNPEMHNALTEQDFINLSQEDYGNISRTGCEQHPVFNDNTTGESFKINEEQTNHNQYRWLSIRSTKERDTRDKKGKLDSRKDASEKEEENLQHITTEFCSWMSGLGGDNNNIEESTLTSLFASGYESKPALSVPIHVVELTNIPPELRMPGKSLLKPVKITAKLHDLQPPTVHASANRWKKFEYGAWYLDPKIWKVRLADEPLFDPSDPKDKEMSEAKKKSFMLDYDLAPMHGTRLFKDFVGKKNSRKPEFLQHIGQILAEQDLDEQQTKFLVEHGKKKQPSQLPSIKRKLAER